MLLSGCRCKHICVALVRPSQKIEPSRAVPQSVCCACRCSSKTFLCSISQQCPGLKSLNLAKTFWPQGAAISFAQFESLINISLKDARCDLSLHWPPAGLESVNLSYTSVQDSHIATMVRLPFSDHDWHLLSKRSLPMADVPYCSRDRAWLQFQLCHQLRRLKLRGCSKIKGHGLEVYGQDGLPTR